MTKAGKENVMEMHCGDKDARFFKVVDVITGVMIPHVTWANDEAGEYDQLQFDESGNPLIAEGGESGLVYERKIGKINFVDVRQLT